MSTYPHALILLACIAGTIATEEKAPAHPFMLWTRDEAAAIRKRIETEPWAKLQYDALLADKSECQTIRNIFRYLVMSDETVVATEKNISSA